MRKYFSGNYVIPSPKLNEDQKKSSPLQFGTIFDRNVKDLFVLAGSFLSDHPALKPLRGTLNIDVGTLQFKYCPWHFEIVQYYSAKYRWKLKKSLIWARGPLHCAICLIRPCLLHYVHKKVRWGAQLATFRIKTLNFPRVMRSNWLANIKLKGPQPPEALLLLEARLNWGPFKIIS